jgi:hypothetical protein
MAATGTQKRRTSYEAARDSTPPKERLAEHRASKAHRGRHGTNTVGAQLRAKLGHRGADALATRLRRAAKNNHSK